MITTVHSTVEKAVHVRDATVSIPELCDDGQRQGENFPGSCIVLSAKQ